MRAEFKLLTPRELRAFLLDDWKQFDALMRQRLFAVSWPTQTVLLSLSQHLAGRQANRGVLEPFGFVSTYGDVADDFEQGVTTYTREIIREKVEAMK